MSDEKLPDEFTIRVQLKAGLWFITSDAHRGYLDCDHDLSTALARVPGDLVELIEIEKEAKG